MGFFTRILLGILLLGVGLPLHAEEVISRSGLVREGNTVIGRFTAYWSDVGAKVISINVEGAQPLRFELKIDRIEPDATSGDRGIGTYVKYVFQPGTRDWGATAMGECAVTGGFRYNTSVATLSSTLYIPGGTDWVRSGEPRRDRSLRLIGEGDGAWVAWTTSVGWLRLGTRAEYEHPQSTSEDIWGGTSSAPLVKTPTSLGPWATREEALSEICSRLSGVTVDFHVTATPRETIGATFEGRRWYVRLGRGNTPEDVLFTGQEYDLAEERRILVERGIAARIIFGRQQWLVHATSMGTYWGRRNLDLWTLIDHAPSNGGFEVPDGSGGTFGYSCDVAEGPFADSFALIPTMRNHGIPTLSEWPSWRSISVDDVPSNLVDHGSDAP